MIYQQVNKLKQKKQSKLVKSSQKSIYSSKIII
jgi:hypothetical protein